ncbi:twin-arginine translocation signal domain-containing protein [Dyadobacter chenwenxiniae]|uniref:Twin-arginine translocation signal domain-containing protein n=1 Tax=Dyadobacter chenwenxiniae TaxID=2906456 RepID=A0A9X1TF74_9BACT|nr:enolase C-terminal domain-like protein [Dyadobacter chenwenxiniae]MCF0062335.1 twin-arginine translocation signal domain-containing protein [Dyadobacter chenwenxiniae]UON83909.1 twin-arginine translocation signal domain-containing protein [Dyadobacter chenwenxiniae]
MLKNQNISRRDFMARAGVIAVAGTLAPEFTSVSTQFTKPMKAIRIKNVDSNFEREPLNPYRFKGSAITDSWQAIAMLESDSGNKKIGIGTQGVLWSDSKVFAAHSESAGNALMYAMSERALQMVKGTTFSDPVKLLDDILPEVLAYGKKITGNPDLRKTFALNALVCVDNAAWLLYAKENGIDQFDKLIPAAYQRGLSHRHEKVASIPSFSVGTSAERIRQAADEGYFIMKLKTGSAGTQQEMIEKDIAFLSAVHKAIGHYETPYTQNGKIPYYFDANGRYEKKETLLRFLDHAKKIGAFEQIAVIEEPFEEHNEAFVGDLGVRVAADESAHTVEDAAHRIDLGYSAIAVKAIAKTLSMTMKITQLAYEKKVPCFCADLTVNPILVDWNKNVAARLQPFPGMSVGLQETNGHQYYKNWEKLMTYHPQKDGSWVRTQKGVYVTDASFYAESGGILTPSRHYEEMFETAH